MATHHGVSSTHSLSRIGRRELLVGAAALSVTSPALAQVEPQVPPNGWPSSANTGHENAPGYPGSLTPYNGAPLVPGATYNFIDFNGLTVTASNVKFFGCRFRSSWNDGWNVKLNTAAGARTDFRFCTIMPAAVAAPPNPEWPSAGSGENVYGGDVPAYMIPYAQAYQYGILQSSGGLLIEDSDIWGFGNAIVLFGTSPKTILRCWIHDAAHEGPNVEYHQDGPGHLDGSGCSNVTIKDCTIASLGNTNAIAFQAGVYNNIQVRNNYLSGFGFCVDMCHATAANTNLQFIGNVIWTTVGWYWGPLYTNFSGNFTASTWKGNRLRVKPGTVPRPGSVFNFVQADDNKFIHPNSVISATDWTP